MGDKVYLIPQNNFVIPEGFQKRDGYFLKTEPGRFCFKVRHRMGREELSCVREAPSERVVAQVNLMDEEVLVLFKEEGLYRVYPYNGEVIPRALKEVRGKELLLKREYIPYRVGITGVLDGVETFPMTVEVPPKEPPKPQKPEELKFAVKGGKLYLYWWSEEEEVRFLVYRDGKLLTPEPIIQNLFVDELPQKKTIYEVRSVNRFGVKSEPARVIYNP